MIKSFLDKLKRKLPSQQNAQQSTTSSCSGNSGREDAEPEDEASDRHGESNFILKLTANVRRKRMSAYVERYSPVPDCDNLDSGQHPTSHRPERDNTIANQAPRTQSFGRRRALSLGDLDDRVDACLSGLIVSTLVIGQLREVALSRFAVVPYSQITTLSLCTSHYRHAHCLDGDAVY